MKFKDWLNEAMTSTADVAGFSRICLPMVRRQWPSDGSKKKRYKVPQLEETSSNLFSSRDHESPHPNLDR